MFMLAGIVSKNKIPIMLARDLLIKKEPTMDNNITSKPVKETYTAEEISEILRISIRKAYMLCENTNKFKVMRLGKRCLRINKKSFDKWFNEE